MTTLRSPPEATAPPEKDSGDIVDWSSVRHHVGFALRAARRRPTVAVLCFLAVASLGPIALAVMPKTYRVEAILTAARNPVVSTLTYPVLQRSFDSDDPAQAAHDAILRRDKLEALCEETGLVERFEKTRSPMRQFRDRVEELVTGRPRTPEERIEALVERLEKRLTIEVPSAQPGASPAAARDRVIVAVEWPDAETAKLLVETAARLFFEGRRERELAMVRDAMGVLEIHATSVRGEVEAKVNSVHALEVGLVRGNSTLSRTDRSQRGRVPQEETLAQLRSTLEAKKLAASEIERFREQRGQQLREDLARQRAGYSERHPDVVRTRKLLDALDAPPPQLAALRTDIATLEQDLERATATVSRLVDDETPTLEYERTGLRQLLAQYSTIRDRIDGARVEMRAAEAGFEHRYGWTVPPRIPRKPVSPNPLLALGSGVLGGLVFSLFAAAALDARSGRVLERWQLERGLGLRVLGELRA
jgi:uncharacterized protein involved in exopolysaccharide biosynthesis